MKDVGCSKCSIGKDCKGYGKSMVVKLQGRVNTYIFCFWMIGNRNETKERKNDIETVHMCSRCGWVRPKGSVAVKCAKCGKTLIVTTKIT